MVGFRLAPCLVLWAFQTDGCYSNSSRQTRGPHCCTARWTLVAMLPRLHAHAAVPDIKSVAAYSAVVHLPWPHCLRKRDNKKQTFCRQRARQNLRKPCYDFSFLLLIRFTPTPHKQSRGVGGTRAIAHSISGDAGPLE